MLGAKLLHAAIRAKPTGQETRLQLQRSYVRTAKVPHDGKAVSHAKQFNRNRVMIAMVQDTRISIFGT